jgi:hypothetical protein
VKAMTANRGRINFLGMMISPERPGQLKLS